MMTLTLPLYPPHSAELGTKVRAQSSIRGCLQWSGWRGTLHMACGCRRWGLWAPLVYASTLFCSHLPFWIRTPRSRGE